MELWVKHGQMKKFSVKVESADVTVETLKKAIHKTKQSYSVSKQRLFFGKQMLEDGHTLASYNIDTRSLIVLSTPMGPKKNKILKLIAKHIKCLAIGSDSVRDIQDSEEAPKA